MTNDATQTTFFSMVTGATTDNQPAASVTSTTHENVTHENSVLDVATEDSLVVEASNTDVGMPHEARRVLVYLMRQGSVIASHKPKSFELICRYESVIRRHLSEVYLQLVLDQKAGVAFVATASSEHGAQFDNEDMENEESSSLISKRTLSLFDTLILLVLRKHYQEREAAGEQKIAIDIERLESYLTPFLPITDHASKDRKKLLARVKEMVKRKILSSIRGTEDRYEITPIIRYVVSASFLESMLNEYTQLAQQQGDGRSNEGDLL